MGCGFGRHSWCNLERFLSLFEVVPGKLSAARFYTKASAALSSGESGKVFDLTVSQVAMR